MTVEETAAMESAKLLDVRGDGDGTRPRWDIFTTVLKAWKVVAACAAGGGALGLACGLALPSWFETSIQLAVVSVDDPTAPGLTNAVEGGGAELSLLTAVLRSREVLDEVIVQNGLAQVYRAKNLDEARAELGRHVSLIADRKANTVSVAVEDRDPARVRAMAESFGEAASRASATLWTARTRRHRVRLEQRLQELTVQLDQAAARFRAFREKNHVVDLPEQVRASVAEAAVIAHRTIEKRLDFHFVRGFGAPDAEEVKRAGREARGAAGALAGLEHGRPGSAGPLLPLDALPKIAEEHDRLKRILDVTAANWDQLARQVEQLRTVEARSSGSTDVVDRPATPRHRSRPARVMLLSEGSMVGFLAGCLLALLLAWRRRAR
jgi:uncharacterized protein involved in exopolysaccharide biosynthesis